nr:unnamed protein product [Callosobruchus analis]
MSLSSSDSWVSEIKIDSFKMRHIVIVGLCLAIVNAIPYRIAENEEGQQYYMVPLSRSRSSKNFNLGASVGAEKHYGGPGGDRKPEFGGFVRGSGIF